MEENQWPQGKGIRYIVASIIIIGAFTARECLLHSLAKSVPYVTFYPGVMFAALYGGFSAGVLATFLSIILVVFAIGGISQASQLSSADWTGVGVFMVACLMISYVCEVMQRARCSDKEKTRQLVAVNKELRQQQQLYQTLVENMPDMITRFDKELRHLYVNCVLEKISERKVAEVIGKTWQELGDSPEIYEPLVVRFKKVFETKQGIEYESVYHSQYGTKYYHNIVVPEYANDGSVNTVLVVTRDLTLQKEMENEITKLELLNIIGEMGTSIAHEIRNPLTTIRGYLQMLGMKGKYAEHCEQFTIMIEELDRTNFIITEFLALSKNKAVKIEIGNLNDSIHTVSILLQTDAFRTGHNLEFEFGDIPDINMDKKEIRQVLVNLVRNGLEAMPTGGTVTVKTSLIAGEVVLSIQDTGNGITQAVLDKLGTPFVTTKDTGTGLGLAVCYRIAERHNAKIEVKTSSEGTTVLVKFKQVQAE